MTCKKCYHCDVCSEKEWYLELGNISEHEGVDKVCKFFKDKSLVVELPCKVGDTVYYPWIYDGQCGVAFNKVESIKIYVNGLPLVIVEDWRSDMPMPISFCNEDFGKTVFLTRQEAEAKLKELNER